MNGWEDRQEDRLKISRPAGMQLRWPRRKMADI